MSGTTIAIPGLEKFRRGLQDLPQKLAKRIMTRALKSAAFVLSEQMKQNVPVRKGGLRASVDYKTKSISPTESSATIGFYQREGNKEAFQAPLLEYGFRYVIKRGTKVIKVGQVRPEGFTRRAFDSQQENMQEIIVNEIADAAKKEWKKLNG